MTLIAFIIVIVTLIYTPQLFIMAIIAWAFLTVFGVI